MVVVVAAIVAAGIIYFARRSRRQYLLLPELPVRESNEPLDLTAIIPARNEASRIGRLLHSLSGIRRLVVDDHSGDGTRQAALQAGAEVIEAPPLARFSLGKPNACWAGAQRADTKWIAFLDADTWYEPSFFPSLLAYASEKELLAASVFPRQIYGSGAEALLLPYAFGLYFCGVNAKSVNNPAKPEALANGQCFLFRREAYQFCQGHRAVATSVIEDVALARLLKRHRMAARVLRAEHLASVRMYESFGDLWRGFEKNSFRFLRANPQTGLLVILASILMTSWLPMQLWLLYAKEYVAAGLFLLVPPVAWSRWYGGFWRAVPVPFAIYGFQLIALSAMFKSVFGLRTSWKGRRV